MKNSLICIAALVVILLDPLVCASEATIKKPNFVVILADDLGASDVGAFGHPVLKTPNIDQLAKNGLQFNNAFLTTSSCSASRASLLTGLYPHNTGAPNLHEEVPADRRLVTSYLREQGYYTAAVGKWHLGEPVRPQFDFSVDPPGDSGAEGWLDALKNRPKDKPFFFWLASRDPHVPYSDLQKDGPYQPKDAVILPSFYDGPDARQTIAQYYTEISRLDSYVGIVVAELKAQNLLDNTYIIFLSDNGAPMPRAKTTLYDAGIRTPLIIDGPHIAADHKTDALVSTIDLAPTIMALTGISKSETMQGQDFLALLSDPAKSGVDYIYAEQYNHGFVLNKRAVRDASYLYIRNFGRNDNSCILEAQPMGRELAKAFHDKRLNSAQSFCFQKLPQEELYDVRKDPFDLTNLAMDPALGDVKQRLVKKLEEHAVATTDTDYLTGKDIAPFKGKQEPAK